MHIRGSVTVRKYNLAVLISGRGKNLEALLRSSEEPDFPGIIRCVISNNANAFGLQIARASSIETFVVQKKDLGTVEECDAKIGEILRTHDIDYVCLAGFMRLLGVGLVRKWVNKIFNIHPSLLPSFPGLKAAEQAHKCGVKIAGCTVHFVDEGMDTGPIVAQAAVRVQDDDNADVISDRILEAELLCFTYALMKILGAPDSSLQTKINMAWDRQIMLC